MCEAARHSKYRTCQLISRLMRGKSPGFREETLYVVLRECERSVQCYLSRPATFSQSQNAEAGQSGTKGHHLCSVMPNRDFSPSQWMHLQGDAARSCQGQVQSRIQGVKAHCSCRGSLVPPSLWHCLDEEGDSWGLPGRCDVHLPNDGPLSTASHHQPPPNIPLARRRR